MAALKSAKTPSEKNAAAVALGSIKTEKKAAASRENWKKAPPGKGRAFGPLSEVVCTCEAGDAIEGHRWDCPRGQSIKRRKKAGKL